MPPINCRLLSFKKSKDFSNKVRFQNKSQIFCCDFSLSIFHQLSFFNFVAHILDHMYRFIQPQMGIQILQVKMLLKVQSYLADKGKLDLFTFVIMFVLLPDYCWALLMPSQIPAYIHLQHSAHRPTLKPLHWNRINLTIKMMNILYMPTHSWVGK